MANDDDIDGGASGPGSVGAPEPAAGRIGHARRLHRQMHGAPRPPAPPCRTTGGGGVAAGGVPAAVGVGARAGGPMVPGAGLGLGAGVGVTVGVGGGRPMGWRRARRTPSWPLAGLAAAVRPGCLRARAERMVARWDALADGATRRAGPARRRDRPAAAVGLVPIVLVGGLLAGGLAGLVVLGAAGRALLAVGRPIRLVLRPPPVGDEVAPPRPPSPRPAGRPPRAP